MSWFHSPLITPATAFYCILGVIVIDLLYLIVRKAMRDGEKPSDDPLSDAPGDWPRDPRRMG